jgi:ribosomal protein S18 acetylase RimI-like enzyme
VYLAEQVIGYMKLNIGAAQTDLQGENGLEICRIYVDHRFQGLRLGQQLIDLAFHTAKEMKVAFVWLGVWEKNAGAIRFYERNGFETISKHDFWLGTDRQTDHIMRCLL